MYVDVIVSQIRKASFTSSINKTRQRQDTHKTEAIRQYRDKTIPVLYRYTHVIPRYTQVYTEQGAELDNFHVPGDNEVSYIHTGSIPSQFGKPLMTLSELTPSIVR